MEHYIDKDFKIRIATPADVDQIATLMQTVYEGIDDKETFICDDIDYVKRHIESEGFILVVENRALSGICGVFIIRYPKNSKDNLGNYVNLRTDDLLRVAHMESAVVRKEARGHHLEEKMIRAAESYIDEQYDIFFAMASPKNIASIKALTGNGFEPVKENVDYHGFIRNVYRKLRSR